MLGTRLLVGPMLVLLALSVLVFDAWLEPWFPFLLATALAAAVSTCYELLNLLPSPGPRPWLCYVGVVALVLVNWLPHLPTQIGGSGDPWHWILGTLLFLFLGIFLVEAAAFRQPGGAVQRISLALWVISYLGLLLCFLIQLRWLPGDRGPLALALAIFVPKGGDIGAYTVGRIFGRHRMAPILSPKKTWEGAVGGLIASLLVALAINGLSLLLTPDKPLLPWWAAVGFGITVGIMAMLGDLTESLIKRDCERKDASNVIPGFGGVLDVLDSVLFSGPVAYAWFVATS